MFEVGDTVRIRSGAYAALTGRVEEVRPGMLRVAVKGLWREVTIELPPEAVERVAFKDEDDSDH